MLYPLFQFFDELDIPGTGVFRYISFRSSMALILSLFNFYDYRPAHHILVAMHADR